MWVYHNLFFATRIEINVSWSGSGTGQMIRIKPDPKHCLKENEGNQECTKPYLFEVYTVRTVVHCKKEHDV